MVGARARRAGFGSERDRGSVSGVAFAEANARRPCPIHVSCLRRAPIRRIRCHCPGSASMAVARPLRGRRGRDEVSWNRCEVEVHDVQKWRAPRREAGPPRHAAGRRIPAGSVLGPEVGVSSSEHEDGTVLSLAVAEAALRRCGGSGPRSENGLRHGTYRPFGNRPWPEAWERPIRPGRWRVA